jgi:hypothetical protein
MRQKIYDVHNSSVSSKSPIIINKRLLLELVRNDELPILKCDDDTRSSELIGKMTNLKLEDGVLTGVSDYNSDIPVIYTLTVLCYHKWNKSGVSYREATEVLGVCVIDDIDIHTDEYGIKIQKFDGYYGVTAAMTGSDEVTFGIFEGVGYEVIRKTLLEVLAKSKKTIPITTVCKFTLNKCISKSYDFATIIKTANGRLLN